MSAAMHGHLAVVEYLLERGVEMEAKDKVSEVISSMCNRSYVIHESMFV